MAPNAILWVRGGPDDGSTVSLSESGTTLLGRAEDNDVVYEEPRVSRQHAAIRGGRDGYWLQDLGSRNGTFVNGVRVEGEGLHLRDQDTIELGGTHSRVQWVFKELGATVEFQLPYT